MKEEIKPVKPSKISDHLANERTYLAWMRTSLGIMAFGFVMERFSLFTSQMAAASEKFHLNAVHNNALLQQKASEFGAVLIAFGMLMSLLAYLRYKRIKRQIEKEIVYAPRGFLESALIWVVAGIGICLMFFLYTPVGQ